MLSQQLTRQVDLGKSGLLGGEGRVFGREGGVYGGAGSLSAAGEGARGMRHGRSGNRSRRHSGNEARAERRQEVFAGAHRDFGQIIWPFRHKFVTLRPDMLKNEHKLT